MLLKAPLGDLPNEVFVVLGSSDEEPFDLVIRCVRAFFREAPPQLLGGSVVSHDHALIPRPRRTPLRCGGRARSFSILEVATEAESGLAVSGREITFRQMRAPRQVLVSFPEEVVSRLAQFGARFNSNEPGLILG